MQSCSQNVVKTVADIPSVTLKIFYFYRGSKGEDGRREHLLRSTAHGNMQVNK